MTVSDSYQQARESIDVEITLLLQSVHLLRIKRNSLSPLLRMPVEIIQSILLRVRDECHPPDLPLFVKYDEYAPSQTTWQYITQTCSRLRQLSLATPSLWCHIDSTRPDWARLCASRAGRIPLVVHASDPETRTTSIDCDLHSEPWWFLPFDLISSTSSLFFSSYRATLPTDRFRAVKSAPLLEHLSVFPSTRSGFYNLTEDFLGGDAPHLQRVELRDCQIMEKTKLPAFAFVRHLDFAGGVIKLGIDDSGLAHLFSQMPNLEVLILRRTRLESKARACVPFSHLIEMPNLRSVQFSGSLSQGLQLLSRLSLPHFSELHFDVNASVSHETLQDLAAFQGGLERVGSSKQPISWQGVEASVTLFTCTEGDPNNICIDAHMSSASQVWRVQVRAYGNRGFHKVRQWIGQQVRTLTLDYGGFSSVDPFRKGIFRPGDGILPNLSTLVIREADKDLFQKKLLSAWLRARAGFVTGVETIRFENCAWGRGHPDDLDDIRSAVGNVVWTGGKDEHLYHKYISK